MRASWLLSLSLVFAANLACKRSLDASSLSAESGGLVSQTNGFLVDMASSAHRDALSMRSQGHPDAQLMETIANNTVSVWYGSWSGPIQQAVSNQANAALRTNTTAVMIAYNIPNRDCGSYSGGGLPADQYKTWITQFAAGIGMAKAIVILEPDALALTNCLSTQALSDRYQLLSLGVSSIKSAAPNARVYIDAGHPNWLSASDVAARLSRAGVQQADGFALNTSNYYDNQSNISYGREIKALVGKNFVIDTSRNGRGSAGDSAWCNPAGRGLGWRNSMQTNTEGVDAFVWLKNPGESDGSCGGGPAAGVWWRDRALELARNADLGPDMGSMNSSPSTQQTSGSNRPSSTQSNSASSGLPPSAPPFQDKGQVQTASQTSTQTSTPSAPAPQSSSQPSAPQPSSTPQTSGSQGTLQARLNVKSTWQTGYCVDLILTNSGSTPVNAWSVKLDLKAGTLTQRWNILASANSGTITIDPSMSYNTSLAAGASLSQQGFCVDIPMGESVATVLQVLAR